MDGRPGRVKVDGRVVAEATASEFREDVVAAGFGDDRQEDLGTARLDPAAVDLHSPL